MISPPNYLGQKPNLLFTKGTPPPYKSIKHNACGRGEVTEGREEIGAKTLRTANGPTVANRR